MSQDCQAQNRLIWPPRPRDYVQMCAEVSHSSEHDLAIVRYGRLSSFHPTSHATLSQTRLCDRGHHDVHGDPLVEHLDAAGEDLRAILDVHIDK